jgi:hypothetical protein
MQIEMVSLDDSLGLSTEDPEVEFGVPDTDLSDPRLGSMPDIVRRAVVVLWRGDVDEAMYQAIRQVQNFAHPPSWAVWLYNNRDH